VDTPDKGDAFTTTITEFLNERHLEGDEEASSKLFLRLRRSLVAIVRNHSLFPALRARHGEEDVVGELWTRLFSSDAFERFEDRGPGSLRAFVYSALDHLMVDLTRRAGADKRGGGRLPKRLDKTGSETTEVHRPEARGPGPVTLAGIQDWMGNCEEALDGRELEAWSLRTREGLDFGAIAERLGCTESAARGVMHRAIKRLMDEGLLDGY